MNQQELLRRITSLSNRSHIPHCSIAEEAKKLKLDGETLEIQNGSLTFTGPVIGTNITPTNSMDIAELRTLMDTRMPFIKYDTLEEIMTNWRSIPYPSIVFAGDGPESYTSTIVIKQNGGRCLCISTKKTIGDYIWVKFQGTDGRDMWSNSSPWRKIPVLDTTDNIICNNVKPDNEDRLKAAENDISILNTYKSIINNTKIRQDEQMALYGTYTYSTGTGQITEANITTNLLVNGNITANNIKAMESNLDNKMPIINYDTMDEIMTNWRSIPYPSIVFAKDGPESYTSTIVIKQNGGRCLCISTKKTIGNYIWLKFQGTDGKDTWNNSSPWRKIPVLDTTDNIICNNVKSDNEDRIKALESKLNNMVDVFYPVGSIYTSMNNTSPATLFGGTWTQITDRFLYCANSSKQTGGSKTITIDNLPNHNHVIESVYDDCNYNHDSHRQDPFFEINGFNSIPCDVQSESEINYRRNTLTNTTGGGKDYMPPYITVYAWYRTA